MVSNRLIRREAKRLYRLCLVEGRVDEARVRAVVDQVLAERPRGYLRLLSHFQRLVKLDLQRRTARVESAIPLPDDLRQRLQQQVSHRYGPGLYWQYAVDPALIAGLRLRVGSDVYDASVLGRLRQLAESFE
ncbi:F0F1 ATP synthase subunit delta [Limisphaera ngatamarikiensis]|uniref:F0F1 ATP synthase subunit delta n=1 Tax=Limisphaera ngatamarikiensis TaxID=1324935 RepID=A0A6M1RYC1_9BACT|nr:F0F1 ATP synthase subunit delta [Limisphaera ngatamarikiensis]NGO38170.1 F0F1 ATP synthase subunit delta [Limisphaera ngatamarikiensis]